MLNKLYLEGNVKKITVDGIVGQTAVTIRDKNNSDIELILTDEEGEYLEEVIHTYNEWRRQKNELNERKAV